MLKMHSPSRAPAPAHMGHPNFAIQPSKGAEILAKKHPFALFRIHPSTIHWMDKNTIDIQIFS
jgi:hypothetical protein